MVTPLALDHAIIGVADLGSASAALGHVLGRRPSWRGRHPTYGTAHVLFRLENAYLELLAPDPEATTTSAWTGSLGRFLRERGEGLFSVALQTPDVAATAAEARERGLVVEDPAGGEGIDLDSGAVRRWANARVPPEATRGTRCFFIEHRSPLEALPPAPMESQEAAPVLAIAAVGIESEEVDGARAMWRETFCLDESPYGDGWRYDLGNASLLLSKGAGSREGLDRWAVLVLRVSEIGAAGERLGVDYERARYFGVPGLLAQACGAALFLTEYA